MTGFVHPEFLVETDWLEQNLTNPDVVVLDCTVHLRIQPSGPYTTKVVIKCFIYIVNNREKTMFEIENVQLQDAVIKVIGVGGCGGNAVDHMIEKGVQGVEFIVINTDAQALNRNKARTQLQIGATITKGLGAGAIPDVGRAAAEEDRERIADMIRGANMIFITAGMGGGTGTGAAPVVAQIAKEMDILTVAVVTKPFLHEGKRMRLAQAGIEALCESVDSLIIVPNEKLMTVLGEDTRLTRAMSRVFSGDLAWHLRSRKVVKSW